MNEDKRNEMALKFYLFENEFNIDYMIWSKSVNVLRPLVSNVKLLFIDKKFTASEYIKEAALIVGCARLTLFN